MRSSNWSSSTLLYIKSIIFQLIRTIQVINLKMLKNANKCSLVRLLLSEYFELQQGFRFFSRLMGRSDPWSKKMLGHFLKWWAHALTNHSWHLGSLLYLNIDMHCWLYSKTSLKRPLKKEDQLLLNAGQKYCRMGSILQSFWPSLSYHLLSLFCLIWSGYLRHV